MEKSESLCWVRETWHAHLCDYFAETHMWIVSDFVGVTIGKDDLWPAGGDDLEYAAGKLYGLVVRAPGVVWIGRRYLFRALLQDFTSIYYPGTSCLGH